MGEQETILEIKSLKKYYPIEKGFFRRVVGYVKAVITSYSIHYTKLYDLLRREFVDVVLGG